MALPDTLNHSRLAQVHVAQFHVAQAHVDDGLCHDCILQTLESRESKIPVCLQHLYHGHTGLAHAFIPQYIST